MNKIALAIDAAEEIAPPAPINNTTTGPELEARLVELASWPRIEYDRARKGEAKAIGCTMETLDSEVAKRRPQSAVADDDFGWSLEPAAEEVDGAGLLSDLAAEFSARVILPPHAANALAVWTLHTHAHESARTSPLLVARSPEKRCGKTHLMAAIADLVAKPMPASNITPAALFRTIEKWQPCLLIDEADTFLGENDELRGVINSGHTRTSAFVIRTVGDNHDPARFLTWSPKAIALIGPLHGTLADRSIIISMRRKRPDEKIARASRSDAARTLALRQRCSRWAADNGPGLADVMPERPAGMNDRAFDNWTHLLAIAEAAGGDWPEKARAAAVALSGGEVDADSARSLLLADIRDAFAELGAHVSTSELTSRLGEMLHRPWPEWKRGKPITDRQIAKLLEPFAIRPRQIWHDGRNVRGYARDDFADAFARYLAPDFSPEAQNDDLAARPLEPAENKAVPAKTHLLGNGGSSGSEWPATPGAEPVLAPSGCENADFADFGDFPPSDGLGAAPEPSGYDAPWHHGAEVRGKI